MKGKYSTHVTRNFKASRRRKQHIFNKFIILISDFSVHVLSCTVPRYRRIVA